MADLRDIKQSFIHELKTVVLPDCGYIETVTGEILTLNSGTTYKFANTDLAYADMATGDIHPSGVTIYDGVRELELDEFTVYYGDNEVTLDAAPSGTVTADYKFYTVGVLDSFPDYETFENADLPMVSVDFSSRSRHNFAIAQRGSWWKVKFFIDIFATNEGMRIDLMDRLQASLSKWLRVTDFSDGNPLHYDGTINTDFSIDDQFSTWIKQVDPYDAAKVNVPSPSEKERFRAQIPGTISYVQ